MLIAVDIDGILTIETEGHDFKNRTPNLTNISYVNHLYNKGHKIVLWTSRWRRDWWITRQWLKKHDVKYHQLKMKKPQFDFFIDDKATDNFTQIILQA
jgi:hypothetical protein